MIDIESLAKEPNALVLSIGAVMFNKKGIKSEFYRVLDINAQMGRKIDPETMDWWKGQSEDAYNEVFENKKAVHFSDALREFTEWCVYNCGLKYWGNGSTFDITIMEDLFRYANLPYPWKYRNVRDMRTFMEFTYKGRKLPREGVAHNALDDARYQAKLIIHGMGGSDDSPQESLI